MVSLVNAPCVLEMNVYSAAVKVKGPINGNYVELTDTYFSISLLIFLSFCSIDY